MSYRIEAATKEEWAERCLKAEDHNRKLVEALNNVDALDPEVNIDACSQSALRGLVLRMGEIARAAIADAEKGN